MVARVGFRGRRSDGPDERIPPGQYLDRRLPGPLRRTDPHTPLEEWTFEVRGGSELGDLVVGGVQQLPRETVTKDIHCVTKWSSWTPPGRACPSTCSSTPWSTTPVRRGVLRRRLHDESSARGRHRRQGVDRLHVRGRAARSRARGPRGCSSRISFWKSANGSAASPCATKTSPASGSRTATTARRPVAGAALLGRLTWLVSEVVEATQERRREPGRSCLDAEGCGVAPRGSARGRAADGRGRLPGGAQLLDRVGARPGALADDRAAGGRRGLPLPGRRGTRG